MKRWNGILRHLLPLLLMAILLTGCSGAAVSGKPDPEAMETGQTEENGADPAEAEKKLLTITAFSVGSADALLLQQGETTILIDTGEADDTESLLEELAARNISTLDVLIITHYDKDHAGGGAAIVTEIGAEVIFCPDYEGSGNAYKTFRKAAKKQAGYTPVDAPTELVCGDMKLEIYPAPTTGSLSTADDIDNNLSLVVMVTYGSCRFLFTGDVEKERIGEMLESDTDWSCDWIKMPHHGRYQKCLGDLLAAASPSLAVICCSDEDDTEKTQKLLADYGINCSITEQGTVVTVSDGETVWFQQE